MGWYGQVFTNPQDAFNEEVITEAWMVNNEHPPLDKIWSGAIWSVARNFTTDLTAHRMGNMLLVALMTGLLYLLYTLMVRSPGLPQWLHYLPCRVSSSMRIFLRWICQPRFRCSLSHLCFGKL
ncbi:MAG: hypothetical protein IPL71_06220 [Anaerolineales bacterium]|uniref:hypothetical protein n=1 Tax=Candidatus Villigracilis proximus TaxID=3140683 RepID=UPI00313640A9|nr:hypothetical protein [Anaerolineales bacterium]